MKDFCFFKLYTYDFIVFQKNPLNWLQRKKICCKFWLCVCGIQSKFCLFSHRLLAVGAFDCIMSQDKNRYPIMGETNPLHSNIYGPPQPGFVLPPPNYNQGPGGPYQPAANYGQPGFPPVGPYPQMPYPQMPYPQGPYPPGPYQQGPAQHGFASDPMGEL